MPPIRFVATILVVLTISSLIDTRATDGQTPAYNYTYADITHRIKMSEMRIALGGSVILTPKEQKANDILMSIKRDEILKGEKNPDDYPPSMHFYKAKPLIRQSEIFRIIQKMPKGAFLHGHNTGMVSSRWVIKNLTYQFNVLTCFDSRGVLLFTFRNSSKCATPLKSVCIERLRSKDKEKYDKQLEKHINLYNARPEAFISEPHKIWAQFEQIFDTVNDFYKYVPVFRAYHRRMLEELYEDNVLYAEIRMPLSSLYGTNRTYTKIDVADELEKIVNDFKRTHPDFIGLKVIFAKRNKATKKEMAENVKEFLEVFAQKKHFVMGFDLIGNEDMGDPLEKFIEELMQLPQDANFFFHAGETKWYGRTDWNLLDAILLSTKRIGHGYALPKHPNLWDSVVKKRIGIELNPISNQVLGLVWDLRNHPGSYFFANDLPVVISADDPGIWNAKGLSYDFYYAFMSLASADADLRTLKKLAINSIELSILNNTERREFKTIFMKKWDIFLDYLINFHR